VTEIVFFVFAALAIVGSIGVVVSRNPVHSALFLVLTLISVAVFFLQENAALLAAVQIIVYASAIVVLFLFVIMLLGVDREDVLEDPIKLQRPAALVLGALLIAEVLYLAGHDWATGVRTAHGVPLKGGVPTGGGTFGTNIQRVARVLFTDFLWPFEITAALLVIAVVGAVVIARRSGQKAEGPSGPAPSAGSGGLSPEGESVP
jgi:NADH-quinone oxidoreductase subunit J